MIQRLCIFGKKRTNFDMDRFEDAHCSKGVLTPLLYDSYKGEHAEIATLGKYNVRSMKSQKGQALTEYAVLVSLVAVGCIAAMALFGAALKGRMSSLVSSIAGDSKEKIDEGENAAKLASEELRQRLKRVNGMTVDTQEKGEVIDDVSLGKR